MQASILAIMGVVSLFVGWLLTLILPAIRYISWGILGFGIVLLAISFVLDYRKVGKALVSRQGKFGIGTTLMISIFIGIILFVNAISIDNYHRFDFTGLSQFTLTSQTKDVLEDLDTEIRALAFFVPSDPYGIDAYALHLLNEYRNNSEFFDVEIVDPDEHPDQAALYEITRYSTVVFESEHGTRAVVPEAIYVEAEHAFTSAILEVSGIVQKRVYFLSGHGEHNIALTSGAGYSIAIDGLKDNLYQIAILDLLVFPAIPENCAALIIAGPQTILVESEINIIKDYLDNGGKVLIMTDPNSQSNIGDILEDWGVYIENGIIIDPSSYTAPNIYNPSVTRDRNVLSLSSIYFPGATAILPQEETPEGIDISALAWTTKDSWQEKDYNTLDDPQFDEGTDIVGPLAIGVIISTAAPDETEQVTEPVEYTVIFAIGDSDFASNAHFLNGNNSDLFLNSVNILTAGEELISIDRKVLQTRRLIIGPEIVNFINISSIGLLPLIIMIIGAVIWWRRR